MKKKRQERHYHLTDTVKIKTGNMKIGIDTLIFNMGSAFECPSKKKGFCSLGTKCYAFAAERQYPSVKAYRDLQGEYWINTAATHIIKDLERLFNRHPVLVHRVHYFRFNESGDFYTQKCITKLNRIASFLKDRYKIMTYGYTARKDLNFKDCTFLVKGSGHNKGNNGQTIVIGHTETIPKGYKLCPMDCTKCHMCKLNNGLNIAFKLHGGVYSKLIQGDK